MHVDRTGNPRLANGGIAERHVEVVDVLSELPLEPAALALSEEIGLVQSQESAHAGPLPDRRAEVHVAGSLLRHAKHDVDVALIVGGLRIGERQRLIEEAEVRHPLVGGNEGILPEDVARNHDDGFANDALVRHVVAADLDVTDDRRLPFRDHPAQVDDRLAIGVVAPDHVRPHADVDVPVVVVERLQFLGRVVPPLIVEVHRVVPPAETEQAGPLLLPEGIECLELIGRKSPVADDFERADAVRLAFADTNDERRLSRALVHLERVVEHLEIDKALLPVELRQLLAQIIRELVIVVLARFEPPESFRARAHLRDDLLVGEMRVALDRHLRDRHPVSFVHIENDPYGAGIAVVDIHRLRAREVITARVIQRIDARARAFDGGRIERAAFGHLHLVPHGMFGKALDPTDGPLDELRSLAHLNDQNVLARRGLRLSDLDIVELAGPVERLDGTLDVAVIERAPHDQTARLNDRGGRHAPLTDHGNGIRHRWRGNGTAAPALGHAQARGEDGETDDD